MMGVELLAATRSVSVELLMFIFYLVEVLMGMSSPRDMQPPE
jgi:hypothetical protein